MASGTPTLTVTPSISMAGKDSKRNQTVDSSYIISTGVNGFTLTESDRGSMSDSLSKPSDDTVSLTTVPIVFTSDGHILEMGMLADDTQAVSVSSKCVSEAGVNASSHRQTGGFPILFQTPSGSCSVDMLDSTTDAGTDMALLQVQPTPEIKVSSSSVPSMLIKAEVGFDTDSMLVSGEMLSDSEAPKSLTRLQPSVEMHAVTATAGMTADPSVIQSVESSMSSPLTLSSTSQQKILNLREKIQPAVKMELEELCRGNAKTLERGAGAESIPVVLKTNCNTSTTLSMVLSEPSGGLDGETSAASAKSDTAPGSMFPEGAVLVETPQGLMLSVKDELRAVTLTEGPDGQGNHLLSISNSCIPVALLSQCQQGNLIEESGRGMVYQTGGEGEGAVVAEGPILCSPAELPLVTQQVLTTTAPEEEQPKKKNRGWPKGKKRKTTPEVHGPRAPMTGYVIFAIARRQEIKRSHPQLPFTEVTKILGQEWSSMELDKKQKYLDEAENDKQRYIDELKEFQKSEIYQTLVKKKRLNDDDVGDETEDDSDELHCKLCKLYFSSLHNKKEHLLGRQHLQAITDQLKKELRKQQGEQNSEMQGDGMVGMEMGPLGNHVGSFPSDQGEDQGEQSCYRCQANKPVDVSSFVVEFLNKNSERDQEISSLRSILRKDVQDNWGICKQIQELKDYESKLQQDLQALSGDRALLTGRINTLKMVPAMFGVMDF